MPFCRKCGAEYSEGDLFCESCGGDLRRSTTEKRAVEEAQKPTDKAVQDAIKYLEEKRTEEVQKPTERGIKFLGLGFKLSSPEEEVQKSAEKEVAERTSGTSRWIVIVILLIIGSVIPIFPKQVPYQANEPYAIPVKFVVDNSYLQKEGILDIWAHSYVIVRNVDDTGGTFSIVHKLYDINGFFGEKSQQAYLGPGNSYTFKASFDVKAFQDIRGEYIVSPPTKTAYRVVTKYKTEQTSLLGLLR